MALTVEELQIVLSCDATTAEDVLKRMDATVKAYTDKFQKYFQNMGGNTSTKVPTLDKVVKGVESQSKKLAKAGSDWKKQYEKTFGETFEESMAKAYKNTGEYVPSGKNYIESESWERYFKHQRMANTDTDLGFGKQIDIGQIVSAGVEKARSALQTLAPIAQSALGKVGSVAKSLGTDLVNTFRLAGALGKSAFNSVENSANRVITAAKNIGSSINKAFKSTILGKFLKRLGTVMLRMAAMKLIRGTIQAVKEGLQELAKVSDSSSKAMNTISAAGGSIKMALGAAVMPIVKALAPVFIALASAINTACDAIARFFAVISGQSSYTAVTFNKNMDSMASAAGGGGGKVKGMLASFDQINLISSQSGGGGGGGGVSSSMSTVGADQPAVSRFAEALKTSWEQADFTFIGRLLSQKLSDALELINWDEISAFGERVANSLATLLNGVFGNFKLADNLGSTLGNAFTTAYNTVSAFVDKLDWGKVGTFITRGIQSFIKNWNVGSLTLFISNKLKAVFSFKAGLYKGINWKGLPSLLKDKIIEAFKGFDFAGVASAIGDWLGSGCRAALEFLAGLVDLLSGIVQNIKDYFTEHIEDAKEAGGTIWDGICAGISEALSTIWNWVKDNIWTPFITAFKKAFGIASPAKNMIEPGNMIALGILEGIKNGLQRVGELFTAFKDIITGYLGIGLEYIRAFFATLIDFVSTRGSLIKLNVEKWMAQMKAFIYNGLANFVESLTGGPLEKILKVIGVDLSGAASSLRQKANEATTKVGELDNSIASAQKKAKEGFDIDAHVDHTKVDEYKKQIQNGISALVTLTADASALKNAIKSAMSMKFSMVFKVPGQSAKTGSIETKYIGLALAKGGLAYGLTPAVIGEYAGASSNPEVVAPLSDLTGILARANIGGNKDSMTKEQANTMISLLQRIEKKENVIQPSVGLGQVVQRSLDAYART